MILLRITVAVIVLEKHSNSMNVIMDHVLVSDSVFSISKDKFILILITLLFKIVTYNNNIRSFIPCS